MRWGYLILAVLLIPVMALGFTRSDLAVWAVQHSTAADSAGTVADGAVDTPAIVTTGNLDLSMAGLRVFTDSLVLSSVYCGYHTWYEDANGGDNLDTNFVACPAVGDSTDTVVFLTHYHSWLALILPNESTVGQLAERTRLQTWVTRLVPGAGFYLRCANYDATNYTVMGDFWVALRFTSPP